MNSTLIRSPLRTSDRPYAAPAATMSAATCPWVPASTVMFRNPGPATSTSRCPRHARRSAAISSARSPADWCRPSSPAEAQRSSHSPHAPPAAAAPQSQSWEPRPAASAHRGQPAPEARSPPHLKPAPESPAQGYPRWSDRLAPISPAGSTPSPLVEQVAQRPSRDPVSRQTAATQRRSSRSRPSRVRSARAPSPPPRSVVEVRGAPSHEPRNHPSPHQFLSPTRPPVRSTPHLSPRSSGDRAPPSGGGSVGSNPTGGAVLLRPLTWGYASGAIRGQVDDVGLRQHFGNSRSIVIRRFPRSDRLSPSADSVVDAVAQRPSREPGDPTFEVTPWLLRAASRASETSLSRLSKRCP